MASQIFLFTAGHRLLVYIRSPSFLFILMVDPIHTSGLVEASASTVYRPLSSGCGVACVIGAWPNAVLVAGGSLAVWIPQQNKTSSAGHRLWQRTWDVCRLQQQSAASSVGGQQQTVREPTARRWRVARRAERWPEWPWERFL